MDLTCPSFVLDETSDYGSRETSDTEQPIGGLCQVAYPEVMTVIFRGNRVFLHTSDAEREIQKFTTNIHAVSPLTADGLVVLTKDGLFTVSAVRLSSFLPSASDAVPLVSGDFQGLEVMDPYSEDPVIITTQKLHGFLVVNMVDAENGQIFRQIPVSCLTSDIAMDSRVTKLALDTNTKDLFITDTGTNFVMKVGLLDNSSCQFGWNGRYIGASVVWAIPTAYGVKICLVLKETTSIMTFHNTGHFMTKSDIGYTIIDGVYDDDERKLTIATETGVEELDI